MSTLEYATPSQPHRASSPILIAIAWIIVGVPAAWGVTQTLHKSMALFQSPPPTTAPAASAAHS